LDDSNNTNTNTNNNSNKPLLMPEQVVWSIVGILHHQHHTNDILVENGINTSKSVCNNDQWPKQLFQIHTS
jgi:hypothetical protein